MDPNKAICVRRMEAARAAAHALPTDHSVASAAVARPARTARKVVRKELEAGRRHGSARTSARQHWVLGAQHVRASLGEAAERRSSHAEPRSAVGSARPSSEGTTGAYRAGRDTVPGRVATRSGPACAPNATWAPGGRMQVLRYYPSPFAAQCRAVPCRAFPCSAVQCCTVLHRAAPCSAVQCSAVQYSAVQCSAVQRRAEQCRAVQRSAAQCSAAQCSAVQCSAGQSSAAQCSAVQRRAAQCSAVLGRSFPTAMRALCTDTK